MFQSGWCFDHVFASRKQYRLSLGKEVCRETQEHNIFAYTGTKNTSTSVGLYCIFDRFVLLHKSLIFTVFIHISPCISGGFAVRFLVVIRLYS